ncbi:hypothetical protein ACQPZX_31720 [Actinoplanes sp. CA-142083]|uniref:hypothetical protein n=1 Tax=Actinoplanes sp. CA-142083 TaxID=3239903 RepID=UPI003D91F177
MNARETDEALRAAGVNPQLYAIRGATGDKPVGEGSVILGPDDGDDGGGWTARAWERGRETVVERFPDEERACRWLYDTLTRLRPGA